MKVGILTLQYGLNYGGTLQAYALKRVLEMHGHQVVILDRLPRCFKPVRYLIKRALAYPLLHRDFYRFRKKYLRPFSKPAFSSRKMHDIVRDEKLDAVVVGSDQVWRKEIFDVDGDYFLDFCDGLNCLRLSYAASLGLDFWNRDAAETTAMTKGLKKLNAVSVREESGVPLLKKHCGIDAQWVLDPVLLAGRPIFDQLIERIKAESVGKFVTYLLDPMGVKWLVDFLKAEKSRQFLHLLPLSPPAPTHTPGLLNRIMCRQRSIPEWIAGIGLADFIITDSFHGTVFAILFEKPFAVLENAQRGNTRIYSLLKMLNLQDRVFKDEQKLKILWSRPIDFAGVSEKLKEQQAVSITFLLQGLEQ